MSEICAIHLGPNGTSYTTRDQATKTFQDDMAKCLVAGLTNDGSLKKKAHENLRAARFYSIRDTSLEDSEDIRRDGNQARKRRWLSPTRDMMTAPTWTRGHAQELFTHNDLSVPVFGKFGDTGVDTDRFIDEVNRLNKRGMLKDSDLPDFDSDESMVALFNKIHDLALEDAQGKQVDFGTRNRVVDNAPGLYLFSELLKRTNLLIEEDFTELWARRIFSIRNLNTWMPQWLFERLDTRTTLAQNVNIERLPSNAQRHSENRSPDVRDLIFYFHAAHWTKLELMRWAESQANGAPNFDIKRSRLDNSIRMMNLKEDLVTFFGEPETNIFGLFSDEDKTGITRVTSTAAAGGAFGSDTSERDRQLLTSQVKAIRQNTERVLAPDTIMLSLKSFDYVVDTLYGSVDSDAGNNKTVLEMADQTLRRMGIKDILEVPEVGYNAAQETRLKAQGVEATEAARLAGGIGDSLQAMVVCNRSADVSEMIIAKDRIMYPGQEERTDRVEVRMLQGSGGLAVYKPAGYTIVTDVGPN